MSEKPDSGNWIKLHRKLLTWEWKDDPKTAWLFITLLMMANWKDTKWRGHTVHRGQLLTGRKQLSEQTGLSEREVRTALTNLKSTSQLTIQTTNRFSIITICNYEMYQSSDMSERPADRPANGPTSDQQTTTSKNNKNIKKEKNKGRSLLLAEFLETIESPEVRNLMTYWTKWRAEQRGKPCTPKAVELVLKAYKDRTADLKRDMEYSIKNDYIGIFPPPPQKQFQAKPKPPEPVQPPGIRDALAASFLNRKIN